MSLRRPKDEAYRLFAERRFDRAAELFERLMALDQADPVLRLQHAEACRRLGLTEKAIHSYRQAAEMLGEMGLYVRAKEAVRFALALAPGDLALLRMLEEINELRTTPDGSALAAELEVEAERELLPEPVAMPLVAPPLSRQRPRARTRSEMRIADGPRPLFTPPRGNAPAVPPPAPEGVFSYLLAPPLPAAAAKAGEVSDEDDLLNTDPTVPLYRHE